MDKENKKLTEKEALEMIHINEPTVQMTFGTNSSPFAGKEGKFVTATKVEERLFKETQKDVQDRSKNDPFVNESIS